MPTTLDQTPSEQALHRVLWLVLLLRAMIIHLSLAFIGAVAYFATGADGFYPLVTDMIRALRADEIQNSLDGKPLRGATYAAAAILTLCVVMMGLRWMYNSIVQLRPWSLRLMGLLVGFFSLRPSHHAQPPLEFAVEHLHPGFTSLALVASAMGDLVVPLVVVLSLWRLSFTSERASLLATLDRRLTRGRFAHINKLLDLPRTPFATPRAAAAYALAFAAAIVLVASAMFLLTVGGAGNKLNGLVTICLNHPEFRPDCHGQSEQWAWSIPFGLLFALVGVKVAALLRAWSRRIGALSVHDVLRNADAPFLLYLRPFDIDDVILPQPRLPWLSRYFSLRPFPVRIEEEFFDVADGYCPLVAIGKPGTGDAVAGRVAHRAFLADTAWQAYALDRIRRAERIVMVLQTSPGVRWEFERILAEGVLGKTLFLFEPAMKDCSDWQTLEQMVVPALAAAGCVTADFRFDARPLGFFVHDSTLVQIVNRNWTTTSYRTAFSSFLATLAPPTRSRVAAVRDLFGRLRQRVGG